MQHLAEDQEVLRGPLLDRGVEIAPELHRHVLDRVDAEAVEVEALDPAAPDVLVELHHRGVLGVEVRQAVDVAVLELPLVVPVLDVAVMVEPVLLARVLGQGRVVARVVGDDVEHDLHAAAVGLGRQPLEGRVVAEVAIDLVEVMDPVAVEAPVLADEGVGLVLVDRRDPDGGRAEVLEVVELLDHALEVAAMVGVRVVGAHVVVVLLVAVVEAIRQDEVDDLVLPGLEVARARRGRSLAQLPAGGRQGGDALVAAGQGG